MKFKRGRKKGSGFVTSIRENGCFIVMNGRFSFVALEDITEVLPPTKRGAPSVG